MPESKPRRPLPDRKTRHRRPDPKERGRARIREYFQIGGLIVGLLIGYSLRNLLGLRGAVPVYGFAVLCGVGGAFLMSTLYVYLFGKPTPEEPTKGESKQPDSEHYFRTARETAESIVIALILAFLFRAFEAEAFVIPTGSMAPTLMGRHRDLVCPLSGVDYRTGASVENEDNGAMRKIVLATHDPYYRYQTRVGYEYDSRFNEWVVEDSKRQSFNGDRIIVSKFAYEFSDPDRWDVIVFKYPGNPKQNYIKRLIGLPEETIWIRHGDILLADSLFTIEKSVTDALERGEVNDRLRSSLKKHGVDLPDGAAVRRNERPLAPDSKLEREWHISRPEMDAMLFVRTWRDNDRAEVLTARIARKSPRKLRAMLQRVDDTRFRPQALIDADWPARWQPWPASGADGANPWKSLDGGRRFEVTAPEGSPSNQAVAWLRYRHMVPNWEDWDNILGQKVIPDPYGEIPPDTSPPEERAGQLITDYYAYNDEFSPLTVSNFHSPTTDPNMVTGIPSPVTGLPDPRMAALHWARLAGMHWVGDLAVEAKVNVESTTGYLWLQLIEGGRVYRCRIDLASGKATVSIDDGKVPFSSGGESADATELTADTKIKRPGAYEIRFANCDDQLTLWVNNRVQKFRAKGKGPVVEATYANVLDRQPQYRDDEPGDLRPVGIGSQGASLQVDRIRVLRDIYYVADTVSDESLTDYSVYFTAAKVQQIFRTPSEWSTTDLFRMRRTIAFELGEDQFFPLGDNSPASKDGRLWNKDRHFVDRRYLTGKALFIYWPHSWDRPIPFFPNFRRMGFVR